MTVSVTLVETRTIEAGNLYRVKHAISASVHISDHVFVFNTADESFSHVATVYDIEKIASMTKAAAETADDEYYRLDTVTRDWDSLDMASEYAVYNKQRLQSLVSDYEVYSTTFAGATTSVITSD